MKIYKKAYMHHLVSWMFVSNRTVPLYLFNGEVPRGVDNVLSGACEDGHLVVPHLWRVLQGGSDLQVETIGVIWERERGREDGMK